MPSLSYITALLLAVSISLSLRAELTVRPNVKVISPQVVVITPPKKPKVKRNPARLIPFAKLKRVDVGRINGKTTQTEEPGVADTVPSTSLEDVGNKLFGNGKNGGGAGTGTGSKAGGGSKVSVNENNKKNDQSIKLDDDANSKRGAGDPPGGGIDPNSKNWPWYPMCLFIDADVKEDVNTTVKGMVDMAAKCNVNLVVRALTVKAIGTEDADQINDRQKINCNIQEKFGKASSSTSVCSTSQTAAAEMCGDCKLYKNGTQTDTKCKASQPNCVCNTGVAGCGQVQRMNGQVTIPGQNLTQAEIGEIYYADVGGKAPTPGSGPSAPSIEKIGACNPGVVTHEAQGHGQWGHPNGSKDGNGIGLDDPATRGGGAEGSGTGATWSNSGCAEMKANSYTDNNGRFSYSPTRQRYYFHRPDTTLVLGDPRWKAFNLVQADQLTANPIAPPPIADRGPGIPGEPRSTGVRNNQSPVTSASSPAAGHPKGSSLVTNSPAQKQANQILANSTTSTPPSIPQPELRPPEQPQEPNVPLPPGNRVFGKGDGFANQIVVNEGAKGGSGGGGGSFSGTGEFFNSVGNGDGGGFFVNEGAPKGGGPAIDLSGGSSGGSSGSGSIGRTSPGNRTPASEEEKKKKERAKKKKREFGDGLRTGSKVPVGNIYQTGGGVESATD